MDRWLCCLHQFLPENERDGMMVSTSDLYSAPSSNLDPSSTLPADDPRQFMMERPISSSNLQVILVDIMGWGDEIYGVL